VCVVAIVTVHAGISARIHISTGQFTALILLYFCRDQKAPLVQAAGGPCIRGAEALRPGSTKLCICIPANQPLVTRDIGLVVKMT
jgi:hypothetical protein